MASSLRAIKRSRVSYDDTDPASTESLVSASMGMFAASEHRGLYEDTCQLAEILMWGKGERGSVADVRIVLVVQDGDLQSLLSTEVIELYSVTADGKEWKSDDERITLTLTIDRSSVTYELTIIEYALGVSARFTRDTTQSLIKHQVMKDSGDIAGIILEVPPPIALKHLNTWYVFDAPCVFQAVNKEWTAALRCSALGEQSPVLTLDGRIPEKLGCWSQVVESTAMWDKMDVNNIWFSVKLISRTTLGDVPSLKVSVHEQESGGGRAFVNSWAKKAQSGSTIETKILWGAVSADFWDRTLNQPEPWSSARLGSFTALEGVDGSLMETGASMVEKFGIGLSGGDDLSVAESSDATHREDNYELVALSSLRFMRDSSVAYPTTIVSFDAGSSGWALEMLDSVAVNAVELVFYLLSGHFQL